ncbi:hypothetical protein E4T56_gene14793, partial [Termitomyces sp. T112]
SAFLGRHTPEAIGDYVAGPNHVLPTGRRARFASGLSVLDFMKRTSFLQLDEAALAAIGPAAVALADAEGLPAHGRSVAIRLAPKSQSRSVARLGAVQALYQHAMEGTLLPVLLDEFHRHRLGAEIEDIQFADADRIHFDDVVKGVLARSEEIDARISEKLAEGWRLER